MQQSGCSAEGMEPFALRVIGDSMSPEFEDGHIIIVEPGHPLVSGAFVVIEYNGEFIFAQYQRRDTRHWLHYLHPAYDNIELTENFTLKGVITQRSSGRRRDTKHYDYPLLP